MKKQWYRMLQDGGEIWRGPAYDVSDAEEKCFASFDETPGSLERFTLQKWGVVHYSKTLKGKDWVTVYENQRLAILQPSIPRHHESIHTPTESRSLAASRFPPQGASPRLVLASLLTNPDARTTYKLRATGGTRKAGSVHVAQASGD